MLAVGMSPSRLLRVVLWEALLLGALGVLVGNAVGLGVSLYFGYAGINLSAFEAGLSVMPGLSDVIRPIARAERSAMISAIVFGVASLVALYPAAKAARLNPVNAIRGLASRLSAARRLFRRAAPRAGAHSPWPVFVLIAARNILRNPRRTAITAGGATFAIIAYVFLFAYFDGFGEQAIDTATRYLTGHLQIERAGFRKDLAPELTVGRPDELLARLRTPARHRRRTADTSASYREQSDEIGGGLAHRDRSDSRARGNLHSPGCRSGNIVGPGPGTGTS